MAEVIPEDIFTVLEKSFGEKIEKFEVKIDQANKNGEGFLGELLFLSFRNLEHQEEHHVAIKRSSPSGTGNVSDFLSSVFRNEINFYTKIIPSLLSFNHSFPNVEIFDNLPKCYGTISEKGKEKVILENLKFKNYEVHPKTELVTKPMFEKIFELYGKYHALSFAFKKLHPVEFSNLISGLENNWIKFAEKPLVVRSANNLIKRVKNILDHDDEEEFKKFENYTENGIEILKKASQYDGAYGVILHGDSWSNNMMFKYNTSREIQDIKLIDFQMTFVGSPALDLSYSLYSGATKEALDNLDELLKIYHMSLDDNLKYYGLDCNNIYPFQVLKEEWKKHSPFGFLMGSIVWVAKNMDEKSVPPVDKTMNKTEVENYKAEINHSNFAGPMYDLVKHMCENNFM